MDLREKAQTEVQVSPEQLERPTRDSPSPFIWRETKYCLSILKLCLLWDFFGTDPGKHR